MKTTHKTILITGANSGLGKEAARQLAGLKETVRIFLGCRNEAKAIAAKEDLERTTGRSIFEIVLMDVSSVPSVQKAVAGLDQSVDALIMNAGGMGGKAPGQLTSDGVTQMFAANVLGHVALLEELLKAKKLNHIAVFAGSEATRGVKKMGMKRPKLETGSVEELASVIDGSFFGNKYDPMQAYGYIKYLGTLWMSALARKHNGTNFITVSPGNTSGTAVMDDLPFLMRGIFKNIMIPFVMPMMGMVHSVEKGAARYVTAITDPQLKSGVFYGSRPNALTGPIMDQSTIFPQLNDHRIQDNAVEAIHRFIR
ncbi:MAG: SDR family NAD(P)-dependent oxidoreductase [Saprospiraceae bacterium]|nr:SDR family NAD(P)-dependent oxidoreductase [Saprospiraceae bacterium]